MCFFGPRIVQVPAPAAQSSLPPPRPTPPRPEPTAEKVVVGDKRSDPSPAQTRPAPNRPAPASVTGQQTTGETGRKRTGQRQQRARRLGTSSLRIPLLKKTNTTEDLLL